MASNLESSIYKESDSLFDFSCFTCQENDKNTEAEFYCEKCSKLYCGKCLELHNSLFKKHATLGKKNISQWPQANVDALEQCQKHKTEKLTGFCEDHNQLICHNCHINNHQKCSHVVLIADKVKNLHKKGVFQQLSATVNSQHQQLIQMKYDFEENMKSLEKSYKKILEEINALRKTINDSLDLLEKNTKKELDTLLATMRTSIQTDIEICSKSINNITCLKEDLQTRKDKSEALSFIKYRKCLDQSHNVEAVLQEMTSKNDRTLAFNPHKTIQQTLSALSGLGFYDPIIKVKRSKKFNVKIERHLQAYIVNCVVSGICVTAIGQLLITDYNFKSVKLLDQTYKVVAHCDLPGSPYYICSVDSSLVAIALINNEVHFIRVTNDQLVNDRILELQHYCMGIAHHKSNLYITDGSALYHYTVDGRLVSKMYKGTDECSVTAIAVSPDGGRIYVANWNSNQLVILSRDGTVISTFTDPALDWGQRARPGLHVTDAGQVLVCGCRSHKIIQVDRDGRQRLAEVVTSKDGVRNPISVYYRKHTGSLIVGMWGTDDIIVFETQ
ncbi:uncharacterized protein LOC127858165 [Dreissena polymorpha]|uniref:uncharacterized protein LOC127858165 n=1 Tax=Dreissena polymorpha TaxID=45954 RepID=UPI002264176C|nr:uncharacterized protein LOC127858165 [Dreissena polymorpha]